MELDTLIHLIAGGAAGTVGAIVTCPLEVVKTRLQSSTFMSLHSPKNKVTDGSGLKNKINPAFRPPEQRRTHSTTILRPTRSHVYGMSAYTHSSVPKSMSIYQCLKHIIQNEGFRGLFKGLGPNIVGVAPSRAIYFCTYSHSKQVLNSTGFFKPDSPVIHIVSAASAGFVSSTATNPIWFVKTRLQLDCDSKHKMTVRECVKRIYETSGIRGFYKGITASYFGISETVVHFVIYEALKRKLIESRHKEKLHEKTSRDFVEFMLAGATSKTIASCVAYPHEVARTRLREEGSKYKTFWQTLFLVWKEEGKAGLYRGLATQLVRQIPNTAIMMSTYELIVYVLSINLNAKFYLNSTRNGNVSTKTHNNNN